MFFCRDKKQLKHVNNEGIVELSPSDKMYTFTHEHLFWVYNSKVTKKDCLPKTESALSFCPAPKFLSDCNNFV